MSSISVVLCTYNGARFVEQQVRSIAQQTRAPDEFVVSDDSSSDGSLDIVSRVLSEEGFDPKKVVVTRNPGPSGVVTNFTHALSRATGELVALSDQDDVWHRRKLETMVSEFDRRPELLLLHTDALLVDEFGASLRSTLFESIRMSARDASRIHDGEAFGVLLRRNFVTGATVMMRRIVVEYALPVPDAWLHDEWLAIAAAAAGVVDFLPEPLIDYRQHSANQIGARTLTFSGATGRLTSSRAARNERLLRRAESLPRRLETLTPAVSPLAVAKASAKLDHERFRSALPASRLRRVLPVFREMVGHRYSLFGGGLPDVVRDVVQPD